MAPVTRSHLSVLRGFLALAAAVLYFSGAAAEARVLLTLDDFGAVGDGVANDTQVPDTVYPLVIGLFSAWLIEFLTIRPATLFCFDRSPGIPERVDHGVRLGGSGRPRRARRQGLPDLAVAAHRAL
jgi:hypothetical protein